MKAPIDNAEGARGSSSWRPRPSVFLAHSRSLQTSSGERCLRPAGRVRTTPTGRSDFVAVERS